MLEGQKAGPKARQPEVVHYTIVFLTIHCDARLQLVDNINIHRVVVTNCVYLQNYYITYQCIYIFG